MRLRLTFLLIILLAGLTRRSVCARFSTHTSVATTTLADTTAEKVLLTQRVSGGWPKQIDEKAYDYDQAWSPEFVRLAKESFNNADATIDNHATSREIRLLVEAYSRTKNKTYLDAAESGVRYLLKMQYANGGFPQFYPDTSGYKKHITYNDNAMVNALRILKDVSESKPGFEVFSAGIRTQCITAIERAISCILKTQIRINGKPTVWCAQHDHVTYAPAKARAYELPSFSGSESVDIIRFLMEIKNPSTEIKDAVKGGIRWLEAAAIEGYTTRKITDTEQPKGRDVILTAEAGSKIWARFYDLQTGEAFFCGRNGIKKAKLSEIENERRVGYAYYGVWPAKLLTSEFPSWLAKNK